MKPIFKQISIALCLFLILSVFASCDLFTDTDSTESDSSPINSESSSDSLESDPSETGSSSEESSEEQSSEEQSSEEQSSEEQSSEEQSSEEQSSESTTETELVEDVVSLVDYTRTSRRRHDLKTGGSLAVSFTVPEGQMTRFYINMNDSLVNKTWYTTCSINVDIYPFDGDYTTSINADPVYSEHITSTLRLYTIHFEDGQIPAGNYLVVISYNEDTSNAVTGSNIYTGVLYDLLWSESTLPEGYEKYNIASYTNGKKNTAAVFCGGFAIERTDVKIEVETDSNGTEKDEYPANAAKVILIGGQSNATGATRVSYLKENISYDQYLDYLLGYSNVKILFSSGTVTNGVVTIANSSDQFIDTTFGHGIDETRFGPELGLAAYLRENYPDETFYIIKYAIGSTALTSHWNPTDSSKNKCLVEFKETVDKGLELLKDEGLDPQIVAFLWMQGESDAYTFYDSYKYYNLQKSLVEDIRAEYAEYEAPGGIAFIDAAISESGMWQSAFILNQSKLAYSKESDINFYIDTNALGLDTMQENNDPAHYDSTSMILLGELYGAELSKVFD